MSNYLIPILIIAGFAVGIIVFLRLKAKKKINDAWKVDTTSRAFRVLNHVAPETSAGIKLYYEPGVERGVPAEPIVAGRERTLERLRCLGYTVNHAHRTSVVIFPMELSPESRTPCFKVAIWPHGNPLWNSEWDQMRGSKETPHYVLAAGQTIAVGEPLGDIFIIPRSTDTTFLTDVSDHEYEHIGYAHYDAVKYYETEYHQTGPHPFIPDTCGGYQLRVVTQGKGFHAVTLKDEDGYKSCILAVK